MRAMWLGIVVVVLVSFLTAAQAVYPVYYDCTFPAGGVENATRLYIVNPNDTGVQYTVTLYSPQGSPLGSLQHFVNAGAANQIWLPDLIAGDRSYAWGMCAVRTWSGYPEAIHVVAERYVGGMLQGYDAVPQNTVGGRHSFFYNAWHSVGGPSNDTHVSVMNPTDSANGYSIELYDASGNSLGLTRGIVNPNGVHVHRLSELVSGSRDITWGLCVIRSEQYAYEQFAVNVFRMRDGRFLGTETLP